MSAFFKTPLDGELREIEITQDGELIVHGYDLAWDDMLVAMSGQKSGVRVLLDKWQAGPDEVICERLGLEGSIMRRLAADWAERALPVFEHGHPGDRRPHEAIKAARDFVAGKIDANHCELAAWAAWEAAGAEAACEAWVEAAAAAARAAWAAWAEARAAARAVRAVRAEKVWQVRHFVHVMECIQAGKDWPKIGETP